MSRPKLPVWTPLRLQVISKGLPRRPRRIPKLLIYFSLFVITEFQDIFVCFVPIIVILKCFLDQLPKHFLNPSTLRLRDGYGNFLTLLLGQLARYVANHCLQYVVLAPQHSHVWKYLANGICFSPTTIHREHIRTPSMSSILPPGRTRSDRPGRSTIQ